MIRDFTESDYEKYIIYAKAFYASDAVAHDIDPKHFHQTFHLILQKSPLVRGLVYELDGEVAGYMLLSFMYSNEFGGIVVLLEEIYIDPRYRGQGIGKQFFAFADAEYKDSAVCFRLEVARNNAKAIELYQSLGFQEWSYLQMVKTNPL